MCVDRKVMIELSDLFYDMEKHYFDMLDAGESCKTYIDIKKTHARELRTTGHIQHNKVDEKL